MSKLVPTSRHRVVRLLLVVVTFLAVLAAALGLAELVNENAAARALVADLGYVGVFVLAIIAGLNAFVPVPAATFVPVFLSAGLVMPLIILALVLGTTVADLIGYLFGRWSKRLVAAQYPKTDRLLQQLHTRHRRLILPAVFCYAAVVPFPNEAIVIPLALTGMRIRTFLVPLVLGTAVNQTALAYGFSSVFGLLLN